jgi:hypothetical protein
LRYLILSLLLVHCSQISKEAQVVSNVTIALNANDCSVALLAALPTYQSKDSTNAVRFSTAQAYACNANVNFFDLLSSLKTLSGLTGTGAFVKILVNAFPSVETPIDDKIPQNAINSLDALFAMVRKEAVLTPTYTIYPSSYNPGSLIRSDRESDANFFMVFVSMSLMGSLLYRYGKPDSNNNKTVSILPWALAVDPSSAASVAAIVGSVTGIPWSTQGTIAQDGCAIVSGFLNFVDGLDEVIAIATESSGGYSGFSTALQSVLNVGCVAGCLACGITTCTECPKTLRHYSACNNTAGDLNTCAALGLLSAINASW